MQLKGAEIMCKTLLQLGVDVLFGHPGGAILPFYDALWAYPQLRHILVRHEQAAAHAADGYSRITGRVGVCVATSGPGATNLITGIMGAKADSVPLVAITGQVARTALGSEAFQECDICSIAAACTKKAFLVMAAADLAPTLHEAFHIAQEGRPGPVLVDVPRDVQLELIQQRCDTPSMYRDFLAAGYEGMQHWSSWPVDYEDKLQHALSAGYSVGQQGDSARGRFVYLWDEGHPGTVIEMAHMTPTRKSIFDAIRAAAVGWDGTDPIQRTWPS